MTVASGAVWRGLMVTKDATGALSAATVGPVGTLYVNGIANAAVVTVAGANPYRWSVTLPALTDGDTVSMYVTATVALIATASVVAEEKADGAMIADEVWDALTAAITEVGSIGELIIDRLDVPVSTRSTPITPMVIP